MDAVAREVVRINDIGLLRSGAQINAQRSSKVGRFLCDTRLVHRPRFTEFPLITGIATDPVPPHGVSKHISKERPEMKPLRLGGL